MSLNLKGLFTGGLKGLADSAKDIIQQVGENKIAPLEAQLKIDSEINRHTEAMESKVNDIEKAYLADVANARSLQVSALNQSDTFSKRFMYYLAAFIILSATAFGVMLFWVKVPEENRRLVEMFADVYLFAGALSVIYFFFGSSKGSYDKTETVTISQKN